MSSPTPQIRVARRLALVAMLVGVSVWLWPFGVGGKMPVGGDVTQFSLGLMAVLRRALRAGRLPIWNDLWGFGFPGLAESQMGVFYPPHVLLYGGFGLELAYTLSLVGHTFWGALGTYWAARRFSAGPWGAALAGFAWATSGFFIVHLPHQWGYTVGSWTPWAWGLAWTIARGEGTRRTPFLLALVFVLQVLPGHFQLAFETQVGVVFLVLGGRLKSANTPRASLAVVTALVAAAPLAGLQLWPTYRLATMASAGRDYDYLSGFAATPFHLVSYVVPGLFRGSPLWRPLVWDPFHTSPEEYLAYIGLVPLFLAVTTICRDVRRDPAVGALTVVAIVTLILSFGPYVPGFRLLCELPGFSFFRAPARWSLATGLALALLAGLGLTRLSEWPRAGRALARFAVVAATAILLAVAVVELALASTGRPGWPVVATAFDRAAHALPWTSEKRSGEREPTFRDLMTVARRPQRDARIPAALARQGQTKLGANELTFTRQRFAIYRRELTVTLVLLAALLAVSPLANRRTLFTAALLALTAVDLWAAARWRVVDSASIRSLTEQSRVLSYLAKTARGTRVADATRNLPMVAGAAPIDAYRTLDLPVLAPLTRRSLERLGWPEKDASIATALRATGTEVRVLDPLESLQAPTRNPRLPGWDDRQSIRDPALAGWLLGTDWVASREPWAATFTVWRPRVPSSTAWLVPLTSARTKAILESWSGDPADVIEVLNRAGPVTVRRPRPERVDIEVRCQGGDVLILSQLSDPQWRGRWIAADGMTAPATILPAFARPGELGWQAIRTPGAGVWRLQLAYKARDVERGLAVSAVAWLIWIVGYLGLARRASPRARRGHTR